MCMYNVISWIWVCNNFEFEIKILVFKLIDGMRKYLRNYKDFRKIVGLGMFVFLYLKCYLLLIVINCKCYMEFYILLFLKWFGMKF